MVYDSLKHGSRTAVPHYTLLVAAAFLRPAALYIAQHLHKPTRMYAVTLKIFGV